MSEICVSIFMLTYNQEDYIAQAIEGVLMQKTNFRYELVIGEDSSTDRTRQICKEYSKKYPKKIKLLLNKTNLGIGGNYVKTYEECTGKYVAICDGDDYWIDSLKLQKQVDFLEENPDYKMIYTNNYDLFPSGERKGPKIDERLKTTGFEDLVTGNYIASVTALFKKVSLTANMKQWIPFFPYGDWPTYLLALSQGEKIYFLNEPTAVYRKDFGTSTALRKQRSKIGEINLLILQNIRNDENFIHRQDLVIKGILQYKKGLMASYNKEKKYLKSFFLMAELCFRTRPFFMLKLYAYSLKRSIR